MQIELYILGVMIICLTFTDLDFSQKYVCTFLKPVVLIIIKSVPTYVHIFWKGNIFKNMFVERKLHYYLIIIGKTAPDDT